MSDGFVTTAAGDKIDTDQQTIGGNVVNRQRFALAPPQSATSLGIPTVSSTALEASHVLKATPGTLFGVMGYNSKTSPQFIQLFDSTTVPADTAVPKLVIKVPASDNFSIDFGIYGLQFPTGIAISNSSTAPTKTIGAADCYFTAQVL